MFLTGDDDISRSDIEKKPVAMLVNRDLKIAVFRQFPQTANVKKLRAKCLCLRVCGLGFMFLRLEHALEVSDLPQGFLHSKIWQSQV